VTETVSAWRERVQVAAMAADGEALKRLFVEGQALLGTSLGKEWATALSALDGTAVTG
jgi:hypothetical protein